MDSDERGLLVTMITGFAIAALVVALAAIASVTIVAGINSAGSAPQAAPAAVSAPAASPPQAVTWSFKSDDEHGQKGPDGKWHDSLTPSGNPTVKAGTPVTVYNYDSMQHSITVQEIGLSVTVPGGSETKPGKATFVVPNKPGAYQWICIIPCDPWAMAHAGYMRGTFTIE